MKGGIIIPTKTKAVLYLRYSSNSQTEQSIEGQRTVCRRYAEANNISISAEYIDRATSASHDTQKRTSFLQMIEDAQKKKFDMIIVYKLDRFARNRYDSAIYKNKLKSAGVKLRSATESLSDSPESVLMESVLEGMAEYYSLELAQKVKRGIDESIKKKLWLGGPTPLGFKVENKRLVPDPVTAPTVRKIFQMVIDGYNYREIIDYLNSIGIRGPRGNPYGKNSIHKILHSKRYIGYYIYNDIEEPGGCEAIIDEVTFSEVQRRLEVVSKKHHDNTCYLLSGKLFCGHCGRQMNGEKGRSRSGRYYYYYKCLGAKRKEGCTKGTIKKDLIEDIVADKARALLTDETINQITEMVMEEYKKSQANDPTNQLRAQVREIDRQIENGLSAVLNGFGSAPLARKLEDLNAQKKGLQLQIQELEDSRLVIDPEMVCFYLRRIREKSEGGESGKKRLIDTFIHKVILWDDPDGGNNRRMQIVFTLPGISETVLFSSTPVPSDPPLDN